MGCYFIVFFGGRKINFENVEVMSKFWGFFVLNNFGLIILEMIDNVLEGKLDVLFFVGGNFLEVLLDLDYVKVVMKWVFL